MTSAQLEHLGTGRFRLNGRLDVDSAIELVDHVSELMDGSHDCRIDLSGIEHSGSAGLALLIEWMKVARERDIVLHYVNMPSQMLAIARVSGLDAVLPLERGYVS